MTKQEAIALAETTWWEGREPLEIAHFWFSECDGRLTLPFQVLQDAVSAALGRPVFTHEFGSVGSERLRQELLGNRASQSFEEILSLIPAEKRLVIDLA